MCDDSTRDGHVIEASKKRSTIVSNRDCRRDLPKQFKRVLDKILIQVLLKTDQIQEVVKRFESCLLSEDLVSVSQPQKSFEVGECNCLSAVSVRLYESHDWGVPTSPTTIPIPFDRPVVGVLQW